MARIRSASLPRLARPHPTAREPASLRARLVAASLDAVAGAWLVAFSVRDAAGRPSLRGMLTVRGGIGIWCVGGWLYTIVCERSPLQATPGKVIANIRVEPLAGGRVGVFAAALRNAFRLMDLLPGGYAVGVCSAMRSPVNQRVGDRVARCVVTRHRFHPAVRAASLCGVAVPAIALVAITARRAASTPPAA